jgi:serine protease Do
MFIVLVLAGTIVASGQSEKRSTRKGYLGVSIQDVSEKVQKKYKVPSDEGAYVTEVVEGSPAETAGLKEDDVVLSFGGKSVYDADDLSRFVQRTDPETKVDVVVWRDGARKTVPVTVGRQKRSRNVFAIAPKGGGRHAFTIRGPGGYGMDMMTLNEQLASALSVPEKKGVFISYVEEGSGAEKAGIKAGDVIVKVGKEPVEDPGDVSNELYDYDEGEKATLELYRKGSKMTVTLEVEESEEPHSFFFQDFGGSAPAIAAPRMKIEVPGIPALPFQREIMLERKAKESEDMLREIMQSRKSPRAITLPRQTLLERSIST